MTVVDRDGLGGSCVLTDYVPLLSRPGDSPTDHVCVDLPAVNTRVKALALAQSMYIARRLGDEGITVVPGTVRLLSPNRLVVRTPESREEPLGADVVLVATGARPRVLAGAEPDGERILLWLQCFFDACWTSFSNQPGNCRHVAT